MGETIVVKLTHEINEDVWHKIVDGFNESFGLNVTAEDLKNGWYVSNPWGYAYHAIAFDVDNELMAYNVFTPMQYEHDIKVVVSGSTFVRPKYRNKVMLFAQLIKALRQRCIEDGFDIEVGVPNHNSINYHCKVNKVKLVKDLSYYVLPVSLSKTMGKRLPGFADSLWKMFLGVHILVNLAFPIVFNGKERDRKYSVKTDQIFYDTRFKGKDYVLVLQGEYKFVYRIYNEEGKRVAYLMDCRANGVKSYKALVFASRFIMKTTNADAILYVGFMHFMQVLMVRLPKKMIPKRLPLACYVINKDRETEFDDISNPDNWNFSLMSFDVR